MTIERASDNPFPSILIEEATEPTAPAAGHQRLYVDSTTHLLMITNSSGTQSAVGGGLSDPMTTRGDIIVRDSSNVSARLAIGSSGKVLTSDGTDVAWAAAAGGSSKKFRLTKSTTQSLGSGSQTPLTFDTEAYDTGNVHFTSSANLTGTVAKNGTTAIVGTSTLFTSELTVGQVISVPGTAVEPRVVTVITDDTHLTVSRAFANTASGQTATRRNDYIGFTTAEYWHFDFVLEWAAATGGERIIFVELQRASGGTTVYVAASRGGPNASNESCLACSADIDVAVGDIIHMDGYQTSGTVNVSNIRTSWSGHTI